MSDGNGGGALAGAVEGAGGDGGADAGAPGGGAGGGGEGGAAAGWQTGLADEALRGNETLARYKSIDDLAKGHIETMAWARGRVPLPGADDEKGRMDFVAKARPEKWEDYEVSVAEGQGTERADSFRQKAHDLGLMPWQAKELGDWANGFEADATSRMAQAAQDELTTRRVNLGPAGYERANEAIGNMFAGVEGLEGFDAGKVMQGLESAFGAGPAWDFLHHMASRTGELDKVDGATVQLRVGGMTPEAAQQDINRRMNDSKFMAEAAKPGTKENRIWQELNERAAGG